MNKFQQAYLAFKQRAVGAKERVEGAISPTVTKGVINAINNRWNISFVYQGYEGVKKVKAGRYTVQPYVYGLNKYTKNNILRAYVLTGGDFKGWVTFRLDRIKSITLLTTKTFNTAAPGFNTSGDGLMSEELVKVKFS